MICHAVDRLGRALADAEPSGQPVAFPFCETLFEHAAAHRRQLCPSGDGRDRVRSILEQSVRRELRTSGEGVGDRSDLDARAAFYVTGLLGLLDWWLDQRAHRSPRDMARLFRAAAGHGGGSA